MPHPADISIHWIQLSLSYGGQLQFPFPFKDSQSIHHETQGSTGRLRTALQEYLYKENDILEILPILEGTTPRIRNFRINLSVPVALESKETRAIEIVIRVVISSGAEGLLAIIPELNIRLFVENEKNLNEIVQEAVVNEFRQIFNSKNYFNLLRILSYENVEIKQTFAKLEFHSPDELAKINKKQETGILNKAARKLNFAEVVAFGLETMLNTVLEMLQTGFLKNILVVGPTGSGKSALIHELSRKFISKSYSESIWETTASQLIKELMAQGGWENRLIQLCNELTESGDFLFVRNFMELFEVGQYEGNERSIGDFLQPFVSNGKVNLISECTEEELAKIEQKSPQYIPLFQIIRLEVEAEEIEDIILNKIQTLPVFKKVKIDEDAIQEYLRLHKRYYPYSGLPGKAITFLESLGYQHFILNIEKAKSANRTLTRQQVVNFFCESSGMPAFLVDPQIPMDFASVKAFFRKAIFGQEILVETLSGLMAVVKTSLIRTGKPIANCLFVGPTGVGKTEMAKVLAEFIFGSRERMIRFDMSEYSGFDSVSRLTGDYHSPDGILTSAVRRQPFSLLLFDEIEKANPAFFDLLLQITGEGRLTDSRGKVVDFCSCIIIMTSNLGASDLQMGRISWKAEGDDRSIEDHFHGAVRNFFRLELLNRFDEILIFKPLSEETIRRILEKDLELLKNREGISGRKLELNIEENVLDYITRKGYGKKYGARQLQRSLLNELILPLARQVNHYDYEDLLIANISLEGEELNIDVQSDPLKFDLLLEEVEKNQWSNHVSDMRRSLDKLKSGGIFIELMNKLTSLERKKNKQGATFWQNAKQTESYEKLKEYLDMMTKLRVQIEALEMELYLNCTGFKPYHTKIINDVRAWESAYLEFKQKIYTGMYPGDNVCHIGLYGREPISVYELYKTILKEKGLQFQAFSLWFRDSYYNVLLPDHEKDGLQSSNEKTAENQKRLDYISHPISQTENFTFLPEAPGDLLVGMVFRIENPCVYLYFEEEAGLVHWYSDQKNFEKYLVEITREGFPKPHEIHRKSTFTRLKERRVYNFGHLKDNAYKINRQVSRQKLADFLKNTLDARFGIKLDGVLI